MPATTVEPTDSDCLVAETRQRLHSVALQLESIATLLAGLKARLPEVPDKVLALQAPADICAAYTLVIDHLNEEIPTLVQALGRATAATNKSLQADHDRYHSGVQEAELALRRVRLRLNLPGLE